MIGYIIFQYIINFIVILITMFVNVDTSFGTTLLIVIITSVISTILIVIIAGKVFSSKDSLKLEQNKIGITKKNLICVLLIIIGYIFIRNSLYFDIVANFDGPISEEDIELILKSSNDIELIITMGLFVIQTIIIAPIFEELFFRGIVFKGMIKKYSNKPIKAIIFSSIIFGVVHMNIPQGINAFIAGVILASLYYYTKNIKLSIFAHFINNFLVFIPIPSNIIFKLVYIVIGVFLVKKGINKLRIKESI